MAHKWERLESKYRQCANCATVQYRSRKRDTFGRLRYAWHPLAGRCSSTKDGRLAKRRNAILAAIKDGRHTPKGIAAHASIPIATVRTALSLAKPKYVVNPRRGWWELAEGERLEIG